MSSRVRIRPVAGKLLLHVPKPAPRVSGGIFVPAEERRDGFRRAFVRELPQGYRGELEPGAEVLLPPYRGHEVCVNGDTLVFIREAELPAAVEV